MAFRNNEAPHFKCVMLRQSDGASVERPSSGPRLHLLVSAASFPNFFKRRNNVSRSFFESTADRIFHCGGVLAKPAGNQRPSFGCQFNSAHPAIVRVILARNEPSFNQPIDSHADGSRREPDLWANRIHREGALMKENFQDAEIGVAQFCPLDALGRVREQRMKGFHENEPDMHAGGIFALE